jgi:hypothetical protein
LSSFFIHYVCCQVWMSQKRQHRNFHTVKPEG